MLAGNLDALAAALGLAAVPPASDGRWVTPAGDRDLLQLRTAGGALVAAHSRRAPDVEAARLVDAALAGRPQPAFAIVIGAGFGHVVDTLVGRDPAIRVLVLEPAPSGAVAFLGRADRRDAIAAGRLVVLSGPDYVGADRAWRVVPPDAGEPVVVVHPVLAREYPEDVRRAGAVAARIIGDARANVGAEAALAGTYLRHTIENLAAVAREGDVDALAGAFAGTPAIVAAAGPSLDRVAADVGRHAGRALVIAVDTALRPLLARGIRPHLVVAVDPSDRNARHLTSLAGAESTWFVAETSVHPRAFPAFAGRTFTFRVGMNHPWPWLAARNITRGVLAAWGSVLVSAFDLAVRVGAGPIAIVGADLAYTGGQPYCRGTAFEEDWAREVRLGSRLADVWARVAGRAGAQQQPDIHGRGVATLPHLVAFRDHLRDRIAGSGVRVVNATGGGILHGPGLTVGTLDDAVAGAPPAGDVRARLRERHARSLVATTAAVLEAALAPADTPAALAALVPGVGLDDMRASVVRARAAIAASVDAPSVGGVMLATEPPVWLPEQTAALAALQDDAGPPPALGDAAPPAAADVIAAASALLAHAPLVDQPVDAVVLRADLLALPLTMVVPIAAGARSAADGLGAQLTHAVAASPATPSPDPYWRDASPSAAVDAAAPPIADHEALARFAVASTVAWVLARTGRADAAVARLAARVAASGPPPAAGAVAGLRLSVGLRAADGPVLDWLDRVPLALYARALSGAVFSAASAPGAAGADATLTGVLAAPDATGVDRPWILHPGGVARRLTPDRCQPGVFASVRDADHAVVSRLDQAGGYRVDADGAVADAAPWPRPIVGEGCWNDGRTFAWGHTPPRLLVRDAGGVITLDEALPFTPVGVETDGEGLRVAARDGVWRWMPGSSPERLVATPPLIASFVEADGTLRLARLPIDRSPGVPLPTDLLWRRGEPLREAGREPLGPCWSTSVAGDWRADALPAAHLVRVSGPDAEGWVVCEAPRTVAWAGGALVVVLIGGAVLHVPDVRGRLRRP